MFWRTASLFLVLISLLDLGRAQTGQNTAAAPDAQQTAPLAVQTTFRIRYVTGSSVYLVGGRNVGLSEGTKLVVQSVSARTSASEHYAIAYKRIQQNRGPVAGYSRRNRR